MVYALVLDYAVLPVSVYQASESNTIRYKESPRSPAMLLEYECDIIDIPHSAMPSP